MTLATQQADPVELSFVPRGGNASWAIDRLRALLNRTSQQLDMFDLSGMNDFVHELDRIRRDVPASLWLQLIGNVVGRHRILGQLHQEPLTRRAFEKPRGYAGDAPLLDLAYRDRPYSVELTRL